jgi:carbonic anhydrase
MSYPLVESRVRQGKMRLNAWWFDVAKADVYGYDAETKRFVLIDEKGAEHFISRLEGEP